MGFDTLAYYHGYRIGLLTAEDYLTGEQKLMFVCLGMLVYAGIDFLFFVWRKLK